MKHSNVEDNRHQRIQTMRSVINHRTDAEYARKELAVDLTEALVAANIPIEKVDHPAIRRFLENRVPGAGGIPAADSVRRWYLPTVQEAHDKELQTIVEEADGVILTVDETTDNITERSVLNLVLTPIKASEASQERVSYIGDQVYLESLNHKVVAAEVMKVVNKFNIPHSNILAFVADNVSYMSKAFTLFSAFFENCVHITCTAHLLHLLFELIQMYNSNVHHFMTKWQAFFKNSVRRKHRFREFIKTKGLSDAKCPKPCVTRWTPWLKGVVWHYERYRFYDEFLTSEHDQSDSAASKVHKAATCNML